MHEHHRHGEGFHQGNCGCHGHQGDSHRGMGAYFGGHGWAFLTHEERIERLIQTKEALEKQLSEIQKTLDLLQPTNKTMTEHQV